MKAPEILLVVVLISTVTFTAHAAVINPLPLGNNTGWEYFAFGAGSADVKLGYLGTSDDTVWIELDKEFHSDIFIDDIGPVIKILFILKNPQAANFASAIGVQDEAVFNYTSNTWLDFHMLITEDTFNINPRVWFDPDYIFKSSPQVPFENIEFDDDTSLRPVKINFDSGTLDHGEFFEIGKTTAHDAARIITDGFDIDDSFLLKEFPTIPEPITLALLGLGSIALLRRRRRKKIS